MPKDSAHEHVPSATLNKKLNWVIFFQFIILAILAASLIYLR
jgi:hypothetical protein